MLLRRSTFFRALIALVAVVVLAAPIANAFQGIEPSRDNSGNVRLRSCSCHYPTQSDNVSVVLRVPERASIAAVPRPITVEVGILVPIGEGVAFGLMLNATNTTDLQWQPNFMGDGGFVPSWVKVNGTVAYNVMELRVARWINATFLPGSVNQTINITLIGMRTNLNNNVSGDYWTVRTASIEVRQQRLVQLNVTVRNDEPVTVSNVRVDFYVDDEKVGVATVPNIEGDSIANASVAWDATFAKNGWHTMRAVIDPLNNITELDRSNNEVTSRIWLGPLPAEEDRSVLYLAIAIVIVVVAVVAGFWYYRQRLYKL